MPDLFVAFACDAEDNHPNYVPGWEKCGSDYNKNPAALNWSWNSYWRDLSDCFRSRGAPVSWLIRVDNGPVFDQMINLFKKEILDLKSSGDEIGIHIHTFSWASELSKWIQTTNPAIEEEIVKKALGLFMSNLGFTPSSVRMGWTAMSNAIMRTLNSNGLLVDSSAVPGLSSMGKFGKRDNIYDWSRTPKFPYHPNFNDYQLSGNMKILEIPIGTLESRKSIFFGSLVNRLSGTKMLVKLTPMARALNLTPHAQFYLTPWWSPSVYGKIIKAFSERAITKGTAFLVGSFHTCDILNPINGKKNFIYEKYIKSVIEQISSLKSVNVKYVTLAEMAKQFKNLA